MLGWIQAMKHISLFFPCLCREMYFLCLANILAVVWLAWIIDRRHKPPAACLFVQDFWVRRGKARGTEEQDEMGWKVQREKEGRMNQKERRKTESERATAWERNGRRGRKKGKRNGGKVDRTKQQFTLEVWILGWEFWRLHDMAARVETSLYFIRLQHAPVPDVILRWF